MEVEVASAPAHQLHNYAGAGETAALAATARLPDHFEISTLGNGVCYLFSEGIGKRCGLAKSGGAAGADELEAQRRICYIQRLVPRHWAALRLQCTLHARFWCRYGPSDGNEEGGSGLARPRAVFIPASLLPV